jgi:hypothetical protein
LLKLGRGDAGRNHLTAEASCAPRVEKTFGNLAWRRVMRLFRVKSSGIHDRRSMGLETIFHVQENGATCVPVTAEAFFNALVENGTTTASIYSSIHEEATISVNQPFMAIFNNLVTPFEKAKAKLGNLFDNSDFVDPTKD